MRDGFVGRLKSLPEDFVRCFSVNGKLRDECLNGEIFYSLKEAQVVIEKWRIHYNTKSRHSSLGYKPPATLTIAPKSIPRKEASHIQ